MPEFAVTAIGSDRPGIVAAVTGALLGLGGNVEDSQMSILGGHFAVMLLVEVPAGVGREAVVERLGDVAMEHELEAISVAEVGAGSATSPPSHVLSVYGADRQGIVHAVSSTLAEAGVNITDLETKLAGSDEAPVYVMVLEVALGDATPSDVEAALLRAGGETGVEVSLRELDAEAL
ncbi:MAG: ACT domain-containing protein [Solirubrobacterales bacterium]